jgi:hypothetical protein
LALRTWKGRCGQGQQETCRLPDSWARTRASW